MAGIRSGTKGNHFLWGGILEGADGSGMMGSGDKLLEAVGASVTRSLS